MAMNVKWVGIDFGQTLCDTSPERTYWMIGDTSKELGEPEMVDVRCHRWRVMKERYGTYPAIKEGHRPEIMSYVFDDHPDAAERFSVIEQKYLKVADGAIDTLKYLKNKGIEISVVAELKRTFGPIGTDQVSRFLKTQNIDHFFHEMITPQGKVNIRDGSLDKKYMGFSKEKGDLYDILKEDLLKRGIKTSEAVMVGDKEWSDLTPAQKRGFKAIHYTGYIFHAPSKADYTIGHFSELKDIIKGYVNEHTE
ncbi:MAG: HAD family hydrolase [Deltaproteobacteria bacterium]|nr:HAD family hydrolase [Deltaproteobacteria bacterium]